MTNLAQAGINLDGKLSYTEGHSIAIHQGLSLDWSTGSGKARVSPNVTMTSNIRMDVLSMSKTVTAAGVVRQLLANGLTPSAKIGPHLPKYWTVDPQVANLTFAHVLTHSGGLVGDQMDFNGIQTLVASPPAGTIGVVSYQNADYSLLRVLLAYLANGHMLNGLGAHPTLRPMLNALTASLYVQNIQKHILEPCGVTGASVTPNLSAPDQAEWFNDNHGTLGDQHDVTTALLTCGADRWNMSAREFGRFIANLTHGTISPNPWPKMRDTRAPGASSALPAYPAGDARLGVWRFQDPTATKTFYGHNGGWSDAFTGWMTFPGGDNIVFFANSTRVGDEQEKMILDSWLSA